MPLPTPDWIRKLAGRFLAFEGPDGSGKTTQYRRLVALLAQHGVMVCEVREPGGTPIGESIRQILLHTKDEMTLRCEMLLYMASRSQLVEQRIRPALRRGEVVIADRFVSSTLAYQGSAGGLPLEEIRAVAQVALQGCFPELVLVFDVDEETASRRISPLLAEMGGASQNPTTASPTRESRSPDRIESRGREFHRKVREGYLEQARREPTRHVIIDASHSADEVWQRLLHALSERIGG